MKKMNKKGFTLAELLIVIAIIAILIAIAIPAFSGALENAKIQTDHANLRSAYAMVQVAKMQGGYLDAAGNLVVPTADMYYGANGDLTATVGDACTMKSTAHATTKDACKSCPVDCSTVTTSIKVYDKSSDTWAVTAG